MTLQHFEMAPFLRSDYAETRAKGSKSGAKTPKRGLKSATAPSKALGATA